MDRLAVPVALIIVFALVAVLAGAPLAPRFSVPGAASLVAVLGSVPNALNELVTPSVAQDVDLTALLAEHGRPDQAGSPPGLVGRWAGVMEVYVPAPRYLADYPALPGSEKVLTPIEAERPASTRRPGGSGTGGSGSSGGAVNYGKD